MVGITAKTINVFAAARIAAELRRNGSRALIVLGGAHLTAEPVCTMERFKEIDVGVYGEGELRFEICWNASSRGNHMPTSLG